MGRPKRHEVGREARAAESLYVPPTDVPNESEYLTLDDMKVRLATEIDPQLAKTVVPQKRSEQEPRRLLFVLLIGLSALVSGAVLAWALSSDSAGFHSDAPAAAVAPSHEPVVAPSPAPQVRQPEVIPTRALAPVASDTVPAGPEPTGAAPKTRRTRRALGRTRAPRRRTVSEQVHTPEPAPSAANSAQKVWIKPPGRKVWMR